MGEDDQPNGDEDGETHEITIRVTPGLLEEITRIEELSGFDRGAQFRAAYSLFRIHTAAYHAGHGYSWKEWVRE
jgi:hypothetical protein